MGAYGGPCSLPTPLPVHLIPCEQVVGTCVCKCAETWATGMTVNLSGEGCRWTRWGLFAATPLHLGSRQTVQPWSWNDWTSNRKWIANSFDNWFIIIPLNKEQLVKSSPRSWQTIYRLKAEKNSKALQLYSTFLLCSCSCKFRTVTFRINLTFWV